MFPSPWLVIHVAFNRHKHVLRALVQPVRPLGRVGVAAAVTTTVVAGGVVLSLPEQAPASVSAISVAAPKVKPSPVPVRVAPISRSVSRVKLEPKPPKITGHLFAVDAVNIRSKPTEASKMVGFLEWAQRVPVSGETSGEWVEVVIQKESRWVHSAFLSETKPKPEPEPEPEVEEEQEVEEAAPEEAPAETGLSTSGSCAYGSEVQSGLVPNGDAVYRAVCSAFPSITSYGGYRPDSGAHGSGRGLDIMISGSAGWEVAEFVRANAGQLGVSEVIYSQQIWTVERSGEGWRPMEDRGSSTANHYDHVHVTVY